MKKTLTITGDVFSINQKEKALKKIEKFDVKTLNNIVELLNSNKARGKFNENAAFLKTLI